jgi:hypothetical protein
VAAARGGAGRGVARTRHPAAGQGVARTRHPAADRTPGPIVAIDQLSRLTGLRIEAVPGLQVGDAVDIEWATGERLRGRSVWLRNDQSGIELDVAMPAQILREAA